MGSARLRSGVGVLLITIAGLLVGVGLATRDESPRVRARAAGCAADAAGRRAECRSTDRAAGWMIFSIAGRESAFGQPPLVCGRPRSCASGVRRQPAWLATKRSLTGCIAHLPHGVLLACAGQL